MTTMNEFKMCLVNTELDIICVTSESCIDCMQKKMNLIVLDSWNISKSEASRLKKNNTQIKRIKCEC